MYYVWVEGVRRGNMIKTMQLDKAPLCPLAAVNRQFRVTMPAHACLCVPRLFNTVARVDSQEHRHAVFLI